jgi:prephenate dehydrogenase
MKRRAGRPTIVVAGLGLIGGSIARGLSRAGWRVLGVDRPAPLRAARAARAITRGYESVEEAAREADVVVLAAPPAANRALLRRLARLPAPPVVTDVGSVKGPICAEAGRLGLARFVGGHPMAGAETAGFAASRAGLFEGRAWILVHAPAAGAAARGVRALVRALGARAVRMEAAEHDRVMAFLSHVPQVVAWALWRAAAADPVTRRHLGVAGPGFAAMTRLARSPRRLWDGILAENRAELRRALSAFRRALAP